MADLGRFKGMGRKYRRAWQIGVFVTLPGLVLGTGTVAGAYGMGVIGQAKVTCEPVVVRAPARDSFDVRVFNASGVDKVAAQAAKELGKRGFRVSETSGVPEGHLQNAVEIAYGKAGRDQALLLATQVPDVRLTNDGRLGTAVSFLFGGEFTGLVAVPPPPPPRPAQVRVDVYNATYRSGLAGQVATELGGRGFTRGAVGNDPVGSFLPQDSAVIRYSEDEEAAAALLAQHVPGARLTKVAEKEPRSATGERTSTAKGSAAATSSATAAKREKVATLALVLGNEYQALTPTAQIPVPPPVKPEPPETVARPCAKR